MKMLHQLLTMAPSTHPLARKDLSRPAMSAWRVSKRATPEGEGSSARDSKVPKHRGKGSMRARAKSAASHEDSLGRSIVALQKMSLKHDQEIRELAGALTDFWLAFKTLQAVKAGMEAVADYMEEVKKSGRVHGLGAPNTHVAAAFVEALAVEAEGAPKQVLTTFMTLAAARQENPSSAAQGEGDDGVQRSGAREGARQCRMKGSR